MIFASPSFTGSLVKKEIKVHDSGSKTFFKKSELATGEEEEKERFNRTCWRNAVKGHVRVLLKGPTFAPSLSPPPHMCAMGQIDQS